MEGRVGCDGTGILDLALRRHFQVSGPTRIALTHNRNLLLLFLFLASSFFSFSSLSLPQADMLSTLLDPESGTYRIIPPKHAHTYTHMALTQTQLHTHTVTGKQIARKIFHRNFQYKTINHQQLFLSNLLYVPLHM